MYFHCKKCRTLNTITFSDDKKNKGRNYLIKALKVYDQTTFTNNILASMFNMTASNISDIINKIDKV